MASTYTKISELYAEEVLRLTESLECWQSFLTSASRNYKLPFDEQVLVFAQRPDAIAVLEIERWNTNFGRWVNKGATGIAVFGDVGSRYLKYYFDIADTHPGKNAREVAIWEMKEVYIDDVIETLKAEFGIIEDITVFPAALGDAATVVTTDNLTAYLEQLLDCRQGSRLEGLSLDELYLRFDVAITSSVATMLQARCNCTRGIERQNTASFNEALGYFNTPATINVLGCAVSDLSEMVLREIASTVSVLESYTKAQVRTVAKKKEPAQNVAGWIKGERTNDGDDLRDGRRLPAANAGIRREPDKDSRAAGEDAAAVFEGAQEGLLSEPEDIRDADGTPDLDRAGGYREAGESDQADGGKPARGRGVEGGRPDAVDGIDEQHLQPGSRERDGGVDLLLRLPTEQERQALIKEAVGDKPAAFSVSDQALNAELKRGSGFSRGKLRIFSHYRKQLGSAANIVFLKKEYGIGGHSLDIDGKPGYCDHDAKGLSFRLIYHDDKQTFSWHFIERRIAELIKLDDYLSEEEKAWLENQREEPGAFKADDSQDHNYRLSLGTVVYIGAEAFEVVELDEGSVSLFDESSPLFPREMSRTEFYSRLAENPLNDHLRVDTTSQAVTYWQPESGQPAAEVYGPEVQGPKGQGQLAEEKSGKAAPLDFRISDDALGTGTPKEKLTFNIEAIGTLQAIEAEGRSATPTEQEVLSRYVGWGALQKAFTDDGPWATERDQLKALLTDEEYAAARASTLNAHYTSPIVIKAIYKALAQMGFTSGNILEPACGIGNFLGLVPKEMEGSRLYGVELDSVTGRIASQLYQTADIRIQGFEDSAFEDNFFDIVVGNVPFGSYGISDKRYDKHRFLIHDYFFAKALDKVRPGGILALITSSGTLDKKNPAVRRFLAERAELIGAIRLPNNAFLANAGTEVTADIVFLQKRDSAIVAEPEWVHLGLTEGGIPINAYFAAHPEMVLGEMTHDSRMYGNENNATCRPFENQDLPSLLDAAISNLHAEIGEAQRIEADEIDTSIPADPETRNFSYTVKDGQVFYRENSRMYPTELNKTAESRVKGLIRLRESLRELIELQTQDAPDEDITREQSTLEGLYDAYTGKYGLINSRANASAFQLDGAYPLLCSLELLDEEGQLLRKADMFSKRTIRPHVSITHADTPAEALAVSLAERAKVDLDFMAKLCGKTPEEITQELEGVIFKVPGTVSEHPFWQTADEYLSGNVREKLAIASLAAAGDPSYQVNAEALAVVIPKDLGPAEIAVRLGATWIPTDDVQQFMFEILETPRYHQFNIRVHYSKPTAQWCVEGKSRDGGNVKATSTFGTHRASAYKIIEETLNLKDVRIFDYVEDVEGKRKAVLNKKETAIAQSKQEAVKAVFAEWIWADSERRERLCRIYNDTFNCYRLRTFDGSHLTFPGMNAEIVLQEHQVNAVARILYGENTLLAHVVGAGKTYEMAAASQELKRLGLCNKSLIVVPNHLTEQWAAEYLTLYPSANILTATKRDFEKKNRRRFCARIATGDYDAVIIGHSQFEKIPMSAERQSDILQEQIDEVVDSIAEMKHIKGESFTIKQLERTRKSLQVRLDRLNDQSGKDDTVTFEELGVDRIFIDESHNYKNLYLFTKMRNVGGIAQTEAQKSADLFMKCRYLDGLTGGKGVVFATGTPISNSMVELYTVQRYLQYGTLHALGLQHFDSWASTFGETVTAIELAPEGTGYRAKTRFSRFYNLPELMSLFRQVADIQTADMLQLPVPKVNAHNVSVAPSEFQKELVAELSKRADRVRNKLVDPTQDNMLLITNDGRKLALDQRLINEALPDDPAGKVSACCDNVFKLWEAHADRNLTQLVFCDLSTPRTDGTFSVYNDIRRKLEGMGIPDKEIAFIHAADTEAKKAELFAKVRSGKVRVLLGSTQKMGAGTNVQDRLVALHDLDCPWRPSDLEQRRGRIERQGNQNAEVECYRYVTEGTFDAYLYQLVENKQKFIGQIMTSKSPVRSAEDVDEAALSYAEIKALAAGDPAIKEKMDLDVEVARLKLLKANHLSQRYQLEDALIKHYPEQIKLQEERIVGLKSDVATNKANEPAAKEDFTMTIGDVSYTERKDAGAALLARMRAMSSSEAVTIGCYRGFQMELTFDRVSREFICTIIGAIRHPVSLGTDALGNITRIDNALERLPEQLRTQEERLEDTRAQMANARLEVAKPFAQEDELKQKSARLAELDSLLNMDEKDQVILDDGLDEPEKATRSAELER